MPISLTDSQLEDVMRAAGALPISDRARYLQRVASLLHGVVIGDGAVSRAARRRRANCFGPRF